MKKSLAMAGATTIHTYLSAFSADVPIPKLLVLQGTCRWLGSLYRNKPARAFDTARAYLVDGSGRVSGQPQLQGTQQYPVAFGQAVPASVFSRTVLVLILVFATFFVFSHFSFFRRFFLR